MENERHCNINMVTPKNETLMAIGIAMFFQSNTNQEDRLLVLKHYTVVFFVLLNML